MATIQVRHVPPETHAVLRRRAAERGMSMQEYLVTLLGELATKPTVEEVLRRAGGRAGMSAWPRRPRCCALSGTLDDRG